MPFMPDTAEKMLGQLGLNINLENLKIEKVKEWGIYPEGNLFGGSSATIPKN